MRYVPRALLAGGLGLAAALLAACGASSGLLSANEAGSLNAELNAASTDLQNNNCVRAQSAIGTLETQVANLPGSVDPTLVSDLGNGAKTVEALARKQCNGNVGSATDTTSTPTTTTTVTHPRTTSTSTSTSTSTTPTSTVTTPSTSTPTTPTTPSTPATTTPSTGTTPGGGGGAPTGGTGNTGNGQGN